MRSATTYFYSKSNSSPLLSTTYSDVRTYSDWASLDFQNQYILYGNKWGGVLDTMVPIGYLIHDAHRASDEVV